MLLDDEYIQDPYPRLAAWRASPEIPVVRLRYGISALLVSRFDDARRVLRSPDVSKDVRRALRLRGRDDEVLSEHMLNADPPDHGRLRRLAAPAVARGGPGAWTPVIERIVDRLVDRISDRIAERGRADLVTDLAIPLPILLICRMLGVPESDQDLVLGLSRELVEQAGPDQVNRATAALRAYLADLLDTKARRPGDDGLSLLAAHAAGGRMTGTEALSTAFLLLFAGHETTTNLIGNGALALLTHPDQRDRLRADPQLLPTAVEELLRYDSPVSHATIRYTTAEVGLGAARLPRGRFVLVSLAGANRDERRFARADRLDITRPPRRHLAFGDGPHTCLGAPLARLQGYVVFGALAHRLPGLSLAADPAALRRRDSTLVRGLTSLPVTWSARYNSRVFSYGGNPMTGSGLPPIVRTLSVPVPPERAFAAFAEHIGEWWDRNFTGSGDDFATAVIEPKEGGRVYEVNESGGEYGWGSVRVWQPSDRVALHWTLGLDGDADTEVEVSFTGAGDGSSVRFEHRGWASGQEHDRAKFDDPGGWDVLLSAYEEYAAST
jgi:cytochrome P450